MAFSSISVVTNALRLRRFQPVRDRDPVSSSQRPLRVAPAAG
jgi:hypothetical protein